VRVLDLPLLKTFPATGALEPRVEKMCKQLSNDPFFLFSRASHEIFDFSHIAENSHTKKEEKFPQNTE
jgi:hypothetical protein